MDDSGKRMEFDSGMMREPSEGKIDWSLVFDGPMLKRLAIHLTEGAKKYKPRNWMLAAGKEEYDRFRESAFRHFMQWYEGTDSGEDHAAAVFFNINGAEYVRAKDSVFGLSLAEHGNRAAIYVVDGPRAETRTIRADISGRAEL